MKWETDGRDWPNRRASKFVASGAHVWHVQRMSAKNARSAPTALLLHGAGASTHSWRDVMPNLARDHDVIAVDLPGHGFTNLGSRARSGLDAMARDLEALLKSLKVQPDILVGHSAGAAIAMRLALDLKNGPKALVSLNGALDPYGGIGGLMFPITARLLSMNPFAGFAVSQMAAHETGVRALIMTTGSRLDDRGVELYRRLIGDAAHVDATIAMMARWDIAPLLTEIASIDIPMLMVAGSRDMVTAPKTAREIADRCRLAEFLAAPGYGHLHHEEAPAEVADAIRAYAKRVLDQGGAAFAAAG